MIIYSTYFDTLGHTVAEINLQNNISEYYPNTTVKAISLSEIKRLMGWKSKFLSLIAFPILTKSRYDITFNRLRSELFYSIMVYWHVRKLDKNNIDVFHFRTQSISLLLSGFFKKYKCVVTIDMSTTQLINIRPWNKFFYIPITWLENRIFNAGVEVVCYSQVTRRAVIKDYKVPEDKVRAIYPSVKNEFFSIEESRNNFLPHILFVGNDFIRKGGDLLLKVFLDHFKNKAFLHIVSNDPLISQLPEDESVIKHQNITPNTNGLLNLFSKADIFVLPTREEAYGIVFSEAMAAALPCIGTNTMAIPELITENEDGLLIDIDNTDQLKEALEKLVTNVELRATFSSKARKKALVRYKLEVFLNNYYEIFNRK